jgi:[ribosomal protein S18]-alanine N-acetyltransferase
MAALHAAAMTVPPPWSAADFAASIAAPGTFAVGDERAFALGRVVLDEVELLTIATHPDHRRRGLARDRLAAFEAEARRRGARLAHLEVAVGNGPAIALYEGAGYGRTGLRRGYYAAPGGGRIDALLLSKPLGPS